MSEPDPRADPALRAAVKDALRLLDKAHLVLAIHDASFPSLADEDVGRGAPASRGGVGLLRFVAGLGFDGVQLGPQGQTSRGNQSPYDATLFSRNVLSLDLHRLAEREPWAAWVDRAALRAAVEANPDPSGERVQYAHAFDVQRRLVDALHRGFVQARARGEAGARALDAELQTFRRANARWLEPDALFELLCAEHARPWHGWPLPDRQLWAPPPELRQAALERLEDLRARHAEHLERWALAQLAWRELHQGLREDAGALGIELFGDLQVGLSPSDAWARQELLLWSYRLGAPPSRTNPAGQPWGHAVYDPAQYREPDGKPGPVVRFLRERMAQMFAEHDGLRIDHPHGLVCPWVYRADDPDPLRAVQQGARLFASPDLPDHPELARFAIARPEQLERTAPRHADGWVRALEPEQVTRYALLLEAVLSEASAHGRAEHDVLCEVLSTQPYPLAQVMGRHGLGRFRVTQKAKLDQPGDVYRSENARPEDWIMVGSHDTPPIWSLARGWHGTPEGQAQAAYLARRLRPDADPAPLERELLADPGALVHAKLADCFTSRARNVMVFFPDLLGLEPVYNRPGTVDDDNWTLRVPRDYAQRYAARCATGEALSLPRVLALALRARGADVAQAQRGLLARLEGRS